jgi:pilus assembly protein FimV
MSRKLILTSAATLLFASADVAALGLGEIRAYSGLNQPFVGEIDVYDLAPENRDAVQVGLAPQEAFDKAGIERYYDLTKLKFTLDVSAAGQAVIRVTSREPIREPYLDMLLEVYWAQGQLVKEYTVLLEPPERMTTPPARLAAPAARSSATAPAVNAAGFPLMIGPVGSGTGLWQLARANAPAGASVAQTALALYRNNQDAFARGNINRLISGKMLMIPTPDELFALDATAAEREFTGAVRGASTARAPLTAVPTISTDPAQLRLLGARAPVSSAPTASVPASSQNGAPSARLEQDLLLALETSESTRQEAQELRRRVQELELQLVTIQQQMQAGGVTTAPQPTTVPPPGVLTPAELPPSVPAAEPLALTDEPPPALPPITTLDAPEGVSPPLPAPTPNAIPLPPVTASPPPITLPMPAPPPAVTETAEVSTWQMLMMPMAGIAGITGLGMLGFAWWRSRQRPPVEEEIDDDSFDLDDDFAEDGPATALLPNEDDDDAQTALLPPTPVGKQKTAPAPSGAPLSPATALAPRRQLEDEEEPETPLSLISALSDFEAETDAIDPLSEADIYIAYGKHEEAQALLLKELKHTPTRLDLQFKLAEACAGAKNLQGLTHVLQSIEALNGQQQHPQQWQQLQALAEKLRTAPAVAAPIMSAPPSSSFRPPAPPAVMDLPLGEDDELDFEALMPSSTLMETEIEDSRFAEMTDIQRAVLRPAPPAGARPPLKSPVTAFEDDELGKLLQQPPPLPEMVAYSANTAPLKSFAPLDDPLRPPAAPSLMKSAPAPESVALPEVLELSESFDLDLTFDLNAPLPEPVSMLTKAPAPAPAPPVVRSSAAVNSIPDSELLLPDDSRLAQLQDVHSIFVAAETEKALPQPLSTLSDTSWQLGGDVWDEIKTKLDLAQAYADMDDSDAARDLLNEVLAEGNAEQQAAAQRLLERIK